MPYGRGFVCSEGMIAQVEQKSIEVLIFPDNGWNIVWTERFGGFKLFNDYFEFTESERGGANP